ncbi:hypothetical protein Emin_0534 [Elusimicrobium minutum Pei191]|uniref:Uncharacterized protein n=1 Tax=Elusimicrobium minutum (strain Pei191) TaxID=445932 RepID=B2KCG8_ELUMP|nr:hypothetical protein [Elusimicrobium minutum]ACC98089.1 hypothetical protein Emin_0534 [Elusimicrobium minutum Pei191]
MKKIIIAIMFIALTAPAVLAQEPFASNDIDKLIKESKGTKKAALIAAKIGANAANYALNVKKVTLVKDYKKEAEKTKRDFDNIGQAAVYNKIFDKEMLKNLDTKKTFVVAEQAIETKVMEDLVGGNCSFDLKVEYYNAKKYTKFPEPEVEDESWQPVLENYDKAVITVSSPSVKHVGQKPCEHLGISNVTRGEVKADFFYSIKPSLTAMVTAYTGADTDNFVTID